MDEIRVGGREHGYIDDRGEVFLLGRHCGAVRDDGRVFDSRGRSAGSADREGNVSDARGRNVGSVRSGEVLNARGRNVGEVRGSRPHLAGAALLLLEPEPIPEPPPPPPETNWIAVILGFAAFCLVATYLIAAVIIYGPMVVAGCIAAAIWGSRAIGEAKAQGMDWTSAAIYVQSRRVRMLGTLVAAAVGLVLLAMSLFSSPSDKTGIALVVPAVGLGIGFTWFLSGKIVSKQLSGYDRARPRPEIANWTLATQITGGLSGTATLACVVGFLLMKPSEPSSSAGSYVASPGRSGHSSSISSSSPSVNPAAADVGAESPDVDHELKASSFAGGTKRVEVASCVIEVPDAWSVERREEGPRSLAVCSGPGGMEARLDVTRGYGRGDPAATPRDLEVAFRRSRSRRYEGLGIRRTSVGSRDAARWDFRLSRKEEGAWTPAVRKAALYVSDGKMAAALVSCPDGGWVENEAALERILNSFRIEAGAGTEASEASFASRGLLSSSQLVGKTAWELSILRNEPYARHGLRFRRKELDDYFKTRSWYKPSTDDQVAVHNSLTEVEKRNVATILAFQKRKGLLF